VKPPEAAGDPLQEYREKRDPLRTNEPFAPERKDSARATRHGRFVVHLHDATRTHYDMRLQIGGTLKSFAVPKGPSLDPAQKHLAMLTEDHPLEYIEFEQVIPEGNYGAGPMIVWDVGRIRYLDGTAEEGMARGKLDFELYGFKLHGRFALIETGSRKGKESKEAGRQWLLVKKPDIHAKQGDIVTEEPRSVLGGLSIEELSHKEAIAAELVARAAALGAKPGNIHAERLTPMLCATEGGRLDDEGRVYELKIDGVRIVADRHERAVALRYRNGRSATAAYPEIARAVAALAPERVVLDGEIVAFDVEGRPTFERLGPRIQAERPLDVLRAQAEVPVTYLVFDILAIGDLDLTGLPLLRRKELLSEVVRGRGFLRALDHLEGSGEALFQFCREQRLEGVVSKKKMGPYKPGPQRTDDWIKIKCDRDDEFVVIGWMPGKGARARLGALCVATYGSKGLTYRGRVGSGLDEATIDALEPRLGELAVDAFPGVGEVPEEAKGARWVKPELVVSVKFLGFTPDSHLRHPVFRGIRADIEPSACRAMPQEELMELAAGVPRAHDVNDQELESVSDPVATGEQRAPAVPAKSRVVITNRDKVFWPDEGYTKGDLIGYYAAVAPAMLPFLAERPVVMVRYPDGIRGKMFYQWNVPQGTPDWLRRTILPRDEPDDEARKQAVRKKREQRDKKEDPNERHEKNVFLLDDVDALVYLANLGTIPLHVLACREGSRHFCDFLTIDFDIGDHPFERAVVLALTLREILDEVGLVGYPKTSGQKGLHVLIPLGPGVPFEAAKILNELFGRLVVSRHPKLATMERRVEKRGGKALIDIGQTGPSRTIVAPYSVRAWPGATVSTPLYWEEVHVALDPRRFTLVTVPARLAESGDPFLGLLDEHPDVASAVGKLEGMARKLGG
jgi:bifunctional non-homologous end joining protein LigD